MLVGMLSPTRNGLAVGLRIELHSSASVEEGWRQRVKAECVGGNKRKMKPDIPAHIRAGLVADPSPALLWDLQTHSRLPSERQSGARRQLRSERMHVINHVKKQSVCPPSSVRIAQRGSHFALPPSACILASQCVNLAGQNVSMWAMRLSGRTSEEALSRPNNQ
ncbi:unnamed protein product [Protopolystoma xenopodis]|uniref:Uncharacterized protein n=1 Tax=Protopolystoma xenopodis TaxID=117903 RepID=A0A3S5BUN3_9PLAT|nr:unnamed protein product [Protopolystoma xenopodis]